MIIELNIIDGGKRPVTFRAPKQSACLDYTLTISGLQVDDDASQVDRLRSFRDAHRAAMAWLCEHTTDIDADWLDANVATGDVLEAANQLLASRNPSEATVGKSDDGRDS